MRDPYYYNPIRYRAVTYKCMNVDGQVIYVGRSVNWPVRLRRHQESSPWWPEVARVQIRKRADEADAWVLEALLYRKHRPRYNVDGGRIRKNSPKGSKFGVPIDNSDTEIL